MATVTYMSNLPWKPRVNQQRVVVKPVRIAAVEGVKFRTSGITVNFRNSVFKTDDPELIKALDSSPFYGIEFCRLEHMPMTKADVQKAVQREVLPPAVLPLGETPKIKRFEQVPPAPPAPVLPDVPAEGAPAPAPAPVESKNITDLKMGELKSLAKKLNLKNEMGEKKDSLIKRIEDELAKKK